VPIDRNDLLPLLEGGRFDAVIGEFENEWLECKRSPYRLGQESEKLQLAKDVSGLANATGGFILLGWGTEKDDIHREDRIAELVPFPVEMFDSEQCAAVLNQWLWPLLENLSIHVFKVPGRDFHALAAISVGQASPISRPVLIKSSQLDDGRRTDLMFGYCERRRANVAHFELPHLHALFRDGLRFDSLMSEGFESIRALIAEPADFRSSSQERRIKDGGDVTNRQPNVGLGVDRPDPSLVVVNEELNHDTILRAIEAAGLATAPAFYLSASLRRPVDLRGLFESRTHPLVEALHSPPTLRDSGFGIDAGTTSTIVEGRLRRAVVADDRLLEIHRSGAIIFIIQGGPDGISWSQRQPNQKVLRLNPLALVEMTYEFALLAWNTYNGTVSESDAIDLTIGFERMAVEASTSVLSPGPLQSFASRAQSAPASTFQASVVVSMSSKPERWAVALLERIYNWFGFESDRIPYTIRQGDERVIATSAIEAIR
jgi:hypothetical protein